MVDIAEIMGQVDRLFGENKGEEARVLLEESLGQAAKDGNREAQLTFFNELIGYYRETSCVEASYEMADQAIALLEDMELAGTIPYATTLLNIANAYRAGGRLQASMECYQKVSGIYQVKLQPDDMLIASLYNNISLLYQEMGEYGQAKKNLLQALEIASSREEAFFETAVTCTNLAATCLELKQEEEAADYFTRAIAIFEQHEIYDTHYCGALSSFGIYLYKKGEFARAAENFRKAMEGMRKAFGENEYYLRLKTNLEACEEAISQNADRREPDIQYSKRINGLQLCRAYYESYGKPMIESLFCSFKDKIAVGLAGQGSDCFGYDDELSRDHDWGPGFCMWVTQDTYQAVGQELQQAYNQLPLEFMGFRRNNTGQGKGRMGVLPIQDFYRNLLGDNWSFLTAECGQREEDDFWTNVPDEALAASVNGQVFVDKEGVFSACREKLERFPQHILYLKIAESAARFAQSGQYNYERMLRRNDMVSARLMLSHAMKEAMKLCHYMAGVYPPHDKWLYKSMQKLNGYGDIVFLIEKLANLDMDQERMGRAENQAGYKQAGEKQEKEGSQGGSGAEEWKRQTPENISEGGTCCNQGSGILEVIAEFLCKAMYERGIISDIEPYLEAHTEELLRKASLCRLDDQELIEKIVEAEFDAFDKVRNVGGRASCQNDGDTFSIMRKSQYQTWSRDMLIQYLYDFQREFSRGHNLIEEKYARMMSSTAPEEYAGIKEYLTELDQEKQSIVESIVQMQVGWMEEFQKEYPALAGNARSIHTSQDSLYNTSYETYLRGEISTYSDKMLELYGRYVVEHARAGCSLAKEIMNNSVVLYGYSDLSDAEMSERQAVVVR